MISQSKIQSPNSDKNYLKNQKLYIMISIVFLVFRTHLFLIGKKNHCVSSTTEIVDSVSSQYTIQPKVINITELCDSLEKRKIAHTHVHTNKKEWKLRTDKLIASNSSTSLPLDAIMKATTTMITENNEKVFKKKALHLYFWGCYHFLTIFNYNVLNIKLIS